MDRTQGAVEEGKAPVASPLRRRLRGERGTSAVEFAVVLTVLMITLFGIVQFGLAFHRWQGLQAAAREGSRIASVGATQPEITTRVRKAQSLFTESVVKIRIDYSRDDGTTWSNICDDEISGGACTSTSAPPCRTAGHGSLVRVHARVGPDAGYGVTIPGFGQMDMDYQADGAFRCEKTG